MQNGPVRSSTLIIFVENLACLVLTVEYILSLNVYNDNCIFTVDSIPFSLKEIFGTKSKFKYDTKFCKVTTSMTNISSFRTKQLREENQSGSS